MGYIRRWTTNQKLERKNKIGDYIPCPICARMDGLSTYEGERYLKCQYCGANYQKKQKFIKSRDYPK